MNTVPKKFFHKKSLRGFTLIEMIISLGIFSIIALAVAGTFASGFSTYKETRALSRNVESAQFAVNTLAKLLRTSTIVEPTTATWDNRIIFYDNSSSRCFQYRVHASAGLSTLQARWFPAIDKALCQNGSSSFPAAFTQVTSGFVTGGFKVVPTVGSPNIPSLGRVTLVLSVKENATTTREARVQTTVSLRDYKEVGL